MTFALPFRSQAAALFSTALCALAALAFINPALAQSGESAERQALVDEAALTIESFARDDDFQWMREHLDRAQGILIVPDLIKGGFIFGGSGGSGVLLARDRNSGVWSYPAFYTMGSVTFGFQIGGEVSEVVLMVMTEEGLDALLTDDIKLGGDVSVALGPVGAGAKAQTADIIAFSRTKGLYGGLNLEGAVLATREDWNRDYYGGNTRTRDILFARTVTNAGANRLRAAVAEIAERY